MTIEKKDKEKEKKSSLYKDIEDTFIRVGDRWYTTIQSRMHFKEKEKGIEFFEKEEKGKGLYSLYKERLERQKSFIEKKLA